MEFRQLGDSGLKVSAIGLGTNNFGARVDPEGTARVIAQALDEGINLLDTANIYSRGLSEEYIGRALKGRRHEAIIATKVGGRMGDGPNDVGASRKHIRHEIEQSLRRLGTDYVDLYQVHFVDESTPVEETVRVLDDLVKEGKIRYTGCSNFAAWQVCEGVWTSESLGLTSFSSVQPYYSMLVREPERELVPFCDEYGIGILPYFPLASGFLTGKYRAWSAGSGRHPTRRERQRHVRGRELRPHRGVGELCGAARPLSSGARLRLAAGPAGGELGHSRRQQARTGRGQRQSGLMASYGRRPHAGRGDSRRLRPCPVPRLLGGRLGWVPWMWKES